MNRDVEILIKNIKINMYLIISVVKHVIYELCSISVIKNDEEKK